MDNLALMVDVGNSYISFAFFKDGKLEYRLDLESSIMEVANIESPLINFREKNSIYLPFIKGGLICSVVPSYNKSIQKAIKKVFNIELPVMDYSYCSDLKMHVDNPKEVGGDLLSDVIGAKELYGYPCLIFDLGTISKVMVVDKNGTFIGTSFFPGVRVCLESMREKTELLPEVPLVNKPKKLLGNSTLEALESGVYYGTYSMVKEYSSLLEKEIGYPLKKILTGGNAFIFKDSLTDFIIDSDLVLKGINFIYRNN